MVNVVEYFLWVVVGIVEINGFWGGGGDGEDLVVVGESYEGEKFKGERVKWEFDRFGGFG